MKAMLEVVGKEVIKPASPAPQDRLQLSSLDHSCSTVYVSTTFFYNTIPGMSTKIISGRLKTSLSKTLSRFYPLTGRIQGSSISCNDEGAVFTEAHTNLLLSDFLKNNINSLQELVPTFPPGESASTLPLLSVKVSYFGSGSGVAITVAISHKICDATSVLAFVSHWAATSKGEASDVLVTSPTFAGVTIYPSPDSPFGSSSSMDEFLQLKPKCVTNRFVFKSSKIAKLKLKAASESVPVPTRVETISSLIWRCATNSSRSNSVAPKSTMMSQAMDLRLRIPSTVLPPDAIGNLQASFFLKKGPESKMEIGEIVAEFRKAKAGVNEMIKENLPMTTTTITTTLGQTLLSTREILVSEIKPDTDVYSISSWCKKPLYKVDFGWGTPVWMRSGLHTAYDNMAYVLLIDSKDGEDVEAWVCLPKEDMSLFAFDQDLLAYAVLNPPVLNQSALDQVVKEFQLGPPPPGFDSGWPPEFSHGSLASRISWFDSQCRRLKKTQLRCVIRII